MEALLLIRACHFHSALSLFVNSKLSTCSLEWGAYRIKMKLGNEILGTKCVTSNVHNANLGESADKRSCVLCMAKQSPTSKSLLGESTSIHLYKDTYMYGAIPSASHVTPHFIL